MKNIIAFVLLLTFSFLVCYKASSDPIGENSEYLYPPHSDRDPASFLKDVKDIIPPSYLEYFLQYSRETGVSLELMARLGSWESNLDPKLTHLNPKSKYHKASIDAGVFMLNSENLKEFSLKYNNGRPVNPHDPETSIRVAFRYMKVLKRIYGSDRMALIAWNGAMIFVNKNLPLPYGTRRLLKEVLLDEQVF